MDEFEDDEVVEDPVSAKKSSKLTAELELLSSASGQVSYFSSAVSSFIFFVLPSMIVRMNCYQCSSDEIYLVWL